ncbi:MAG: TonB family protein [Candidatus Aminicenantes bacterium]|nr:TonB family protein [Candidatus Aminicenantes bacterium]
MSKCLKYLCLISLLAVTVCKSDRSEASVGKEKLQALIEEARISLVLVEIHDGSGKVLTKANGFFVSETGDMITDRPEYVVPIQAVGKTFDGKTYPLTTIVAEDEDAKLVIATVGNGPTPRPLKISSDPPAVGDRVLVICGDEASAEEKGKPLRTITNIRDIPEFGKTIELSGPLVHSPASPIINLEGELVGVATSVVGPPLSLLSRTPFVAIVTSDRISGMRDRPMDPRPFGTVRGEAGGTTFKPGQLVTPVEIPEEIDKEELSDMRIEGRVERGVEGGVVGGVLGGVVGDVLREEAGDEEAPVRAVGEIKPPKIVKQVDPVYPETARQARVEGIVILEVTTDIYGRVAEVKLLRSIALLDQAAIDAVKQWVYEPMIINGRPRGVIFTVPVRFQLK